MQLLSASRSRRDDRRNPFVSVMHRLALAKVVHHGVANVTEPVLGALLAKEGEEYVDAVPVAHTSLPLAPDFEIAFDQVDPFLKAI